MKGRIIPMIGLAVVFGALSIFVANMWLENAAERRLQEIQPVTAAEPAKPEIQFKTIVVAAKALDFGSRLDDEAVREIPWPQDAVPDGAFLSIAEMREAGERVVLRPIERNEPVLLGKLSGANGKAALSNLLRPGMRAVTLRVDEVTGVGGFVTVGDHVDVVLTRKAGSTEGDSGEAAAGAQIVDAGQITETVLEAVRVLSVGTDKGDESARGRDLPSVTLEVSAQGAQKIALARSIGTLSLSLRPAADAGGDDSAVKEVVEIDAAPTAAINTEELTTIVVRRGMAPESYQVPSSVTEASTQ